jgi:hypothetical protein
MAIRSKHTNNPCLGSCLYVFSDSERGICQTCYMYMQNHALLRPLVNDILSKQMITEVVASGLAFFLIIQERQCE